jgi:hypothetical protein
MLQNFLHERSMIIVYLKELKCNIKWHMPILKMVWLSLLLRELNWLQNPYCITAICLLLVKDMQFYMLLTLFNYDQLHIIVSLCLICGNAPSISHLRKFGCAIYAPILPPQRTTMGPHKKMGIYMGYHFPSIIKYL